MNVALIGFGYWGPNLARNIYQNDKCNLKYIVDIDKANRDRASEAYKDVIVTSNFDNVLMDADVFAVFIATPGDTHFSIAQRCLKSKRHVFIEKPITTSFDDSFQLLEDAAAKSLKLAVGHVFLYSKSVQKIKEIIDSGDLGDVLHIHSQRLNLGLFNSNYNVIWDLAPHDLSVLLYLLDSVPYKIQAFGSSHIVNGIEDTAVVSLEFENMSAYLQYSWLDPNKVRKMTIVGSKKMLVYDDIDVQEPIKIFDKNVERPEYPNTFDEFVCSYKYGDILIPKIKSTEPLRDEVDAFLVAAIENKGLVNDGVSGVATVSLIEGINKSLKERSTISVDDGILELYKEKKENIKNEKV